jgi:hybrid cluster-associated redox disulfide protein
MKFTKTTTIAEILVFPKTEEILAKYKLPCLHCPMAESEIRFLTIGQVCERYGIGTEDLLAELNNLFVEKF